MIRCAGANVAVTPLFDSDMSPSGLIHIPDEAKERCDQGIVKYVGPLVRWLQPGDTVLFSGYSGTLLSVEGEGKLIILPEAFVICKLDLPDTDIPGLYFRGVDGEYFTATYEMALEMMARAFENEKWFRERHMNPATGRLRNAVRDKAEMKQFSGHPQEDLVPDNTNLGEYDESERRAAEPTADTR